VKLYYSPTSPYVRKVVMTALEAGLDGRIERVVTDAWSAQAGLPDDNPLCKVPTLVTDDGLALFDSPVICEYLASLSPEGARLFPPAGVARWQALRLQALGDGLCDAALARRLEAQRPAEQRSAATDDRHRRAMTRACDALESGAIGPGGPVTVGVLAVLAALGYLDLRFAEEDWRRGRPRLAAWFAEAGALPAFQQTRPAA
jgi:glutathione S-transferase